MRNLLQILFAFLFPFLCYSQNTREISFQLNWTDSLHSVLDVDHGNPRYYLSFADARYDESKMLPLYTTNIPVDESYEYSCQIIEAEQSIVSFNGNWGQSLVSGSEFEIKLTKGKLRNQSLLYIQILPLRKDNFTGNFERLNRAKIRIIQTQRTRTNEGVQKNATVSQLNDGEIYKISITKTGIHKIDYSFLQSLGIDVNNIDPRKIQILGNGAKAQPEIVGSSERIDDLKELAVTIVGEADGQFNNNDYILFYGIGPEFYEYSYPNAMFLRYQNIYSNSSTYFIKIANNTGKRIQTEASISVVNYNTNAYDAPSHYEENKLNLMEKEFALPPSGRLWVGNSFQITRSQNFSFPFANRIQSDSVKIQSVYYSRFFTAGSYNISANGNLVYAANISTVNNYIYSLYARTHSNRSVFLSNANNIDINFSIINTSSTAESWLDYITLNARCQLIFTGGQMPFSDSRSLGQGTAGYNLSNANNLSVWDVTYAHDVKEQSFSGSGSIFFGALADTLRSFIAFDGTNFFTPNAIGRIANQNLHGVTSSPELLIVYHKDFESAAQNLATHRSNFSGISTLAVDVEKIYNEFSSGNKDISAIRDFARLLYERSSTTDSLRYLLLLGTGSFDYKNLGLSRSKDNNYVLAYETAESLDPLKTFTTDDFFALLSNGEGNINIDHPLDIAVGRLPVSSSSEAEAIVNKIIRYDTDPETLSDWKNKLTFFADDQDGNLHINDADDIAQFVSNRDSNYLVDKIYLDAYQQVSTAGGSRYPDVNAALLRNLFKGSLVFSYLGHGGADGLAQERVFTTTEINTLNNRIKMPLFVTATCSFAPFDDPEINSAGSLLMLNPNGGGIALLTTLRVVLADANRVLTFNTFDKLFTPLQNRMPTIGEVLQSAKNNSGNLSASNSRKYLLLGDPSMTLAYPRYRVATTSINGKIPTQNDSISALQQVRLEGEIQDLNGNRMNGFNGTVYVTVYDKEDTIYTRANDADSYIKRFPLRKKVIFKGRASVVSGQFSIQFIVPVDINYSYGYGKISYYAENGTDTDAHGSYLGILIGGTSPNAAIDDRGPEVKVYMNNENFASGGITDPNPVLLVRLRDSSGINTIGNGIGHDLTGIISFIQDGKEKTYNLNDFYEADLDNFRSGKVSYPLQNLPDGLHKATVKAWDVYNNLGEGFTEFVVASSSEMALSHVLNYPNPFTTQTEFMFEHNLPSQDLEIMVQVYTISGKLVKTIQKDITATENSGYRIDGIFWDGLDDYGDRLGKGVYVYKVSVRATGPAQPGTEIRSVLSNEQYQKLVILR